MRCDQLISFSRVVIRSNRLFNSLNCHNIALCLSGLVLDAPDPWSQYWGTLGGSHRSTRSQCTRSHGIPSPAGSRCEQSLAKAEILPHERAVIT